MLLEVAIANEGDVVILLSRAARALGAAGVDGVDAASILTVCAELGHNIARYGKYGQLRLTVEPTGGGRRIVVEASDHGPGIADVEAAMRDHFSTGNSLGLGLPGVRRLTDTLEITSRNGCGTRVIATRVLGAGAWPKSAAIPSLGAARRVQP